MYIDRFHRPPLAYPVGYPSTGAAAEGIAGGPRVPYVCVTSEGDGEPGGQLNEHLNAIWAYFHEWRSQFLPHYLHVVLLAHEDDEH